MRRMFIALGLLVSLVLAAPVGAITNGQPDNAEHPYVGELLFYVPDGVDSRFDDPGAWYSCSGTLLTATVVVTAGHCTFGIGLDGASTTSGGGDGSGGTDVWIDFSEAAHFAGFPPSSDYDRDENQQRYEDRAAWLNSQSAWHPGTATPHPEYDDHAFYIHDAGVVVLDDPFSLGTYGDIPTSGYLDQYGAARRDSHRFEVVGYGLERVLPILDEGGDTRRQADVKLNSLKGSPKDTYALFSNNPGKAATGGSCFGDSGGPIFDDTASNLVVAVTSFGFSPNCTGVGGGYRLDQPDDLAFLATFGITP